MELLLAALVAYGLCFGFQNKLPFLHNQSEFTDKLLACSYCTGFWCGIITYGLFWFGNGGFPIFHYSLLIQALCWGFASAALCYILDTTVQYLEANTQWGNEEEGEDEDSEE